MLARTEWARDVTGALGELMSGRCGASKTCSFSRLSTGFVASASHGIEHRLQVLCVGITNPDLYAIILIYIYI